MEPIILPRISDQKPLVSVVSITYNHEPYIRDCLEGFLMQKTDFPIEIIIHDDASTDHTADILREYYEKRPDFFHVLIEKENQYSQGKNVLGPLFEQAQGNYIAICEGDDYWIDPFKLQKQFDFMESHHEYSMCGSRVQLFYQKDHKKTKRRKERCGRITLDQIMRGNPYATCTVFLKKDIVQEWERLSLAIDKTKWKMSDLPLFLYCATKGDGFIIPSVMACYRILEQSASHGDIKKLRQFVDSGIHIRLSLIKELKLPYTSKRILKQWAYGRVKQMLKWREFNSKTQLCFYWRMYWKNGKDYSAKFIIMFSIVYLMSRAPSFRAHR